MKIHRFKAGQLFHQGNARGSVRRAAPASTSQIILVDMEFMQHAMDCGRKQNPAINNKPLNSAYPAAKIFAGTAVNGLTGPMPPRIMDASNSESTQTNPAM
ncbi:hypothetical protein [Methylomicrobium lacus]|uniref:hypothetical protein n=1 Tax=Methylomicrobium lacus TaxID=136992 RepID=UPI00045E7FFB|nr:hypothetical protein [Methylomicrobium lacus]